MLISRAAKAIKGVHARPPIISAEVADDLDETRRFRNKAMHSYGTFEIQRLKPSIDAAKRLAHTFLRDIAQFRTAIDPDP